MEQMKQSYRSPRASGQTGAKRDEIQIVGGSVVRCDQRGDKTIKSVSNRQNADKKSFSPDSMLIVRPSVEDFVVRQGAC